MKSRNTQHTLRPLVIAVAALFATAAPSAWAEAIVSAANATIERGEPGTTGEMLFKITRSGDLDYPVSVAYITRDGSAKAGVDYVAQKGRLEILAGQTTATIKVPVIGKTTTAGEAARRFGLLIGKAKTGPVAPFRFQEAGMAPGPQFAVGSAAADFNGDGRVDLVFSSGANGGRLSFLRNDTVAGSSTQQFTQGPLFSGLVFSKLRVGDVNGDGKPDVVSGVSEGDRLAVYINTTPTGASDLSFIQTVVPTVKWGWSTDVALADFDGDGVIDVVASNPAGGVPNGPGDRALILRNTTPRGSTSAVISVVATLPASSLGTTTRSIPQGAVTADFDRDGRQDFALANLGTAEVAVFMNTTPVGTRTPTFAPPTSQFTFQGPTDAVVGDLNGDGAPDIVTANTGLSTASQQFTVIMNRSQTSSGVSRFDDAAVFGGFAASNIAVKDMDGDGQLDIVLSNLVGGAISGEGTMDIIRNTSKPGPDLPKFELALAFPLGDDPQAFSLGDFNNDGRPDIAAADFVTSGVFFNFQKPGARAAVPDKRAVGTILP